MGLVEHHKDSEVVEVTLLEALASVVNNNSLKGRQVEECLEVSKIKTKIMLFLLINLKAQWVVEVLVDLILQINLKLEVGYLNRIRLQLVLEVMHPQDLVEIIKVLVELSQVSEEPQQDSEDSK